jgi:hypothetical protein
MVGGEAVKLKEGTYTLRILLSFRPLETQVAVKTGEQRALTLRRTGSKWILQ